MAFTTQIVDGSRDYSKRESILMSDVTNAQNINKIMESEGQLRLKIKDWAVVQVHNDQSKENKDYKNYVFVTDGGEKYYTGSQAFFEAYDRIRGMMEGEEFEVDCVLIPSKNYAGRNVLSCSIV